MAARRLVAVLIVLLVISTIAAMLAPETEQGRAPPTRETRSRALPGSENETGRRLQETVAAGGPRERIVMRVGDQLALRVRSRTADQVALTGFGETEATDRYAPAAFNVYASERGEFAVRLLESRRTAATIVVRPRVSREARSERARDRAADRRG